MKIEEIFAQKAARFGVDLSSHQIAQFNTYYQQLIAVNQLYNLTSIKDRTGVYHKHFLDSISLLEWVDIKQQRVLDIGSGAGFPGIPLKIAEPNFDVILIDSNHKKIEFLNNLIKQLDLKKISTLHSRVEDYHPENLFDIVISRAVSKLSVLFELSFSKLKTGGKMIAYKGVRYQEEIAGSEKLFEKLGIRYELHKASLDSMHHYFIVIHKNYDVSLKSRAYAQIVKNPLW